MTPVPRRRSRAVAAVPLVVAVLVFAAVISGSGKSGHEVFTTVTSATNVIEGQEVRAAGQPVGNIASMTPLDGGRAVRLGLELDDHVWPLRQGAKLELRWGGTISYNNRYFAITQGPVQAPPIPDGGSIPRRDVTLPVEFDRLLQTLSADVRRDARVMLKRGGLALRRAAPGLRRTLDVAPPAVTQGHAVIKDLVADTRALDTLVRSTDSVVHSVRTADPGVSTLVRGAADTFSAVAAESRGLSATLQQAPGTLTRTRDTLARADHTLTAAGRLTGRLTPGVRELRKVASPLNSVLRTVVAVGPDARATLATARRATSDLNPLLARATDVTPQVDSIGDQAVRELKCIRPYTPEIVAFASTWGDFLSPTDGKDKYIRANLQSLLPVPYNVTPNNSGELFKAFPGLRYGFPRPPGAVAGQPWFLPECGAGPQAINPFADPEAR